MDKINESAKNIIIDNNFLFTAFENRLVMRLVHIFEKHKIPMNKNIIRKNLEENLINHLTESNSEIINKYTKLLSNYESIITSYVESNTKKEIIKESTMSFISRIAEKNKTFITTKVANNFLEYINSIIYVYDNNSLNVEVVNRINNDTREILEEFNRNNYNFVIESINEIIKNIISNMWGFYGFIKI